MAKFNLKNWHGKEQQFDHDKIFVRNEDGEIVQFTEGRGESVLETLEVTENGTYTPSNGVDGFNSVVVEVPTPEVVLQDKTIKENGTFMADDGFDGLGQVIVDILSAGGSANIVQKYGNIFESDNTGTYKTISHGLGVVPDVIIVVPSYNDISSGNGMLYYIGDRKSEMMNRNCFFIMKNESTLHPQNTTNDFTTVYPTTTTNQGVHSANASTFVIPPLVAGIRYRWFAISGLYE